MLVDAFRSLLAEPRAPLPPKRVWRDWVLVAALATAAVLEGLLRAELVWRSFTLLLTLAFVFTLLWRRTNPLIVVGVVFGATAIVNVLATVNGVAWEGLHTAACVLLLPYSLFRWGSGGEAVIGLAIILASFLTAATAQPLNLGEVVGGTMVLLFPAALGASVRYQDNSQLRAMEQTKLLEREQLARELHDTVAHHVSAIAVQAQAGRSVAASRPAAAVDALKIIEEEASRTLVEMRTIVGALRQHGAADLAPQSGVANIERLARNSSDRLRVDVELEGDLDDLAPSVDAAIYRLAQESITNTMRHARHATRINVRIDGDGERVRLTVRDDGELSRFGDGSGRRYGLLGMAERAKLLGGSLHAGPHPDRGWTVDAVLPKKGAAG